MRMTVGFLACLVVAIALLGATPVAAVDDVEEDVDPDAILLDVHLVGDDRAAWTIEHRYLLEDEAAEAAFEELEADIEDDPDVYRDRFADRMERTAETAATATGRTMSVENVTVETETRSLPRTYGVVRYSFTWNGFAVADDDAVVAGDAVAGVFLDGATHLRVSWTEEYDLAGAAPTPDGVDDRSLIWHGPREFATDEPVVELEHEDGAGTLPGAVGGTAAVAVVVLLAALVGVGMAAGWRYRSTPTSVDEEDTLLSNEEQVLRVLADHDGRMKQQAVVQELGWTDAKTSQVVSELRDAGEIESFRLGRENVLRLAEEGDVDE